MNELLNHLPTANNTQIKNWIKHQEIFEDDGVDNGEWNNIDWNSFQALFSDSAKETIKKSIAEQEIEESLSFDKLCRTILDYVINCAYIIKSMPESRGFAFFKLAKCLHIYDYRIQDFEPDICAIGETPKHSKWSEYLKEINAICELINYETDNINVLIEKLLLLSWEGGYDAAAMALENTYVNKWGYEDIFKDWNEYKFFPWFDITCMDKDFNSLNIEFDFENYRKIDNETVKFYTKKAFATTTRQKYQRI